MGNERGERGSRGSGGGEGRAAPVEGHGEAGVEVADAARLADHPLAALALLRRDNLLNHLPVALRQHPEGAREVPVPQRVVLGEELGAHHEVVRCSQVGGRKGVVSAGAHAAVRASRPERTRAPLPLPLWRGRISPRLPRAAAAPLQTDTAPRIGVSAPASPRYLVRTLLPAEYPTAMTGAPGNAPATWSTTSWASQVSPAQREWLGVGVGSGGGLAGM